MMEQSENVAILESKIISIDDDDIDPKTNINDTNNDASQITPFIIIQNNPIYFQENWNTGIGGGLWSTGLAIAKYFASETNNPLSSIRNLASMKNDNNKLLNVLELGSGNGFLSVCLIALASKYIDNIVITDTKEHLNMIEQTIQANSHLLTLKTSENDVSELQLKNEEKQQEQCNTKKVNAYVLEHMWGEFDEDSNSTNKENTNNTIDNNDTYITIQNKMKYGLIQYDLIIGSDLVYRKELYIPFINSLQKLTHENTISIIGITMLDTQYDFFILLKQNNFIYEKLADYIIEPEYRGITFGIFIIQKQKNI